MVGKWELGGVPPAAHAELTAYLRQTGSTLSVAEALGQAVKLWLDTQRDAAAPRLGYQWKSLFLPSGSTLRLSSGGKSHFAEVKGDQLLYMGHPATPSRFVFLVAGPGRNAWRELWVRLPGEKAWVPAGKFRERAPKAAPQASPVETMAQAAKSMSAALQTTLALVQHIDHRQRNPPERRIDKQRRWEDTLTEP